MRVSCPAAVLAVAAALVPLAVPTPAAADDPIPCRPERAPDVTGPIDNRFQTLDPSAHVNAVLGSAQDAGVELDPPASGTWSAGVAPGALSVDAARAAIEQRIRASYSADDAAFLLATMRVIAQPYSSMHLRNTGANLTFQLFMADIRNATTFTTCRILLTLHQPNGVAQLARAQQIAAPFGDAVRVRLAQTLGPEAVADLTPTAAGPPAQGTVVAPTPGRQQEQRQQQGAPTAGKAAVRFHALVSVAVTRRCVRGTRINVRPREKLQRLSVTVAKRTRTSSGKAIPVVLSGPRTTIAVTLTALDGRTATRTLTYRRCAA